MERRLRQRLAAELGTELTWIRPLTGGASYRSFEVCTNTGERWLVRAAGTSSASIELDGVGLHTEAELLRRAQSCNVPVPQVRAVLTDPPALVVQWLEGESLGGRIARRPEFAAARRWFAGQCGTALARIHRIDGDGLALPAFSSAGFVTQTHGRYRRLGIIRPMLDAVARRLVDSAPPEVEPTVVHGDFRNGNLMVDRRLGVVGVLDWELARLGDPMSDLGYLMVNSWRFGEVRREVGGCGSAEDLFAAYRAESGRPVDPERVGWWQLAGSFWWAVTCLVQASRFDPTERTTVPFAAIGPRVSEAEVDCADLLIDPIEHEPLAPAPDDGVAEVGHLADAVSLYRQGPKGSRYDELVVANMAATVAREGRLGSSARRREFARLVSLLDADPNRDLESLRTELADLLWQGRRTVDEPAVGSHLAATALDRLQIDQPGYRRSPSGQATGDQDR